MLRNIFSFHIHSAQSSNTKFCCKLRSSDRESCYFDVWENESFKNEFHKFSWCTLDHEFIFSEMKCASSTFGFLLIAQKMVSPRGLEVYISRQSYLKMLPNRFYTCTFFFVLFTIKTQVLTFGFTSCNSDSDCPNSSAMLCRSLSLRILMMMMMILGQFWDNLEATMRLF